MKRLICLTAVICGVFPVTGWAFDWTPDTTRYLSDPSFLPMKGQIESFSSLSYNNINEYWRDLSGNKTEHYFSKGDTYTQYFYYGITDRLRISGSADLTERKNKFTFYGNRPEIENSTHNYSNPTFDLTYRAIEQTASPVSVDAAIFYTPPATANNSQSVGGSLFINKETKSLTIQGNTGIRFNDSYKFTNITNGESISSGFNWAYFVGITSQLRLSQRWAVNSGATMNMATSQSSVNSGAGFSDRYDSSLTPYIALEYHVIPNKAVIGLEYSHGFIGDDTRSGAFNGTWTNQSSDAYSLHLNLLF
jgi:hypothetical protein